MHHKHLKCQSFVKLRVISFGVRYKARRVLVAPGSEEPLIQYSPFPSRTSQTSSKRSTCFVMADELKLLYLIEGTQQPSCISISYNSNGKPVKVDTLRKNIFDAECERVALNHDNFTLLKVCSSDFPFPLSD